MGSMLVPVAVTTHGHLSLVKFNQCFSNVCRLMQLLVAPVSYNALNVRFELFIGKRIPVAGPTTTVQISTKCRSVLCISW